MAQSLSKILLHVIFSTNGRRPLIAGSRGQRRFAAAARILTDIRPAVHAYLAGACRALGSEAFRVGGPADHVHIACTLSRTQTVSALLQHIKESSSVWIKKKEPRCAEFAWQSGYAAFSLGASQLSDVIRYIDCQEEHHGATPFRAELLELLDRYQVEYDERYLWD